jgi:hypothetical protein
MITAHAMRSRQMRTFGIAELSTSEQRDRIERLLAAFMGDQNNFLSFKEFFVV